MRFFLLLFFYMTFIVTESAFAKEARLMRFPNAVADTIAFSYGGDIYVVPKEGGTALRITSSEGYEMFPKISPDGRTVAFSAEYDGAREVYTIPITGGSPKRMTYSPSIPDVPDRDGPDKIVMQWSADGSKIIYRANRDNWHRGSGQLFFVDIKGGPPNKWPMPQVGFVSVYDADNRIAYNKIFREFRAWKGYRGGQADDIRMINMSTGKRTTLTENPAQDIFPMLRANTLYFLSDRDGRMNLFQKNIRKKTIKQLTHFKDFDIKFPSLGDDNITFTKAGNIYFLDLITGLLRKVKIRINTDFPKLRSEYINLADQIENFDLSPKAQRVLFEARGDIFTVPAENGKIRNLTESSGSRERNCKWSPDGKYIAYISDKNGEDEIYIQSPEGGEPVQLTKDAASYKFDLAWSPDSRKILFSDKSMKLSYIDIMSKKLTLVNKSRKWEQRDYTWSPDAKWIAYSDYERGYKSVIYLYSVRNGKSYPVTDPLYESYNPVFDPEAKYLYFISKRTFAPKTGNYDQNFIYDKMSKIYGMTLQDTSKSPFGYISDEAARILDMKEKKLLAKRKKASKKKGNSVHIDLLFLKNRVFEFPIEAGNYSNIQAIKGDFVFYMKDANLMKFDIKKREESELGNCGGYLISPDGKKKLVLKSKQYFVNNVQNKVSTRAGKLNFNDLQTQLNRREEWTQIYNEACRQMKHFFYDKNMHGVDWDKVCDKYSQFLPNVAHRLDLNYIISEAFGELGSSHCYIGGGDMPEIKKIKIGLLGADYKNRGNSYQIQKILSGHNWDADQCSPLAAPGLDIREKQYIISIDNQLLSKDTDPYKALVNKAGEYVKIKVNSKPNELGAKEYHVKTLEREDKLRYMNWVESKRSTVDRLSKGKIAYLHIPDMTMNGLNEFVKHFYSQTDKQAMIIDIRGNSGGKISPMIIQKLSQELMFIKKARNQTDVETNPGALTNGPIVCLINENTVSDGEIFAHQFKKAELGTTIGSRTFGGIAGVRKKFNFIDGGYMYRPEFDIYSPENKQIGEAVGIVPDIEVEDDGSRDDDSQLIRSVDVLLEKIRLSGKSKLPKHLEAPDKK